jgi:hypothetical protein
VRPQVSAYFAILLATMLWTPHAGTQALRPLPAPAIIPPGPVVAASPWDGIVIMSCDVAEATIRFTTDDTEPTEESAAYTEPLVVPVDAQVRAKAFRAGWAPSPTSVAVFNAGQQADEQSDLVFVLRGGRNILRPAGDAVVFDKVRYDDFAKIVSSATGAATWHDPTSDDGRAVEIDARLPGIVAVDDRATSTLFTALDQIERSLPEGWRFAEIGITDVALLRALTRMHEGLERQHALAQRPRHLYQVHYRFEHR